MPGSVSPLALPLPPLAPLAGVRLAAGAAAIRYRDRDDLLLVELAEGTTAAGVFTRNKCPGAPVDWCRAALKGGRARGLVANAGNANVFTGEAGRQAVRLSAAKAAELIGCQAEEVMLASTGVIGEKFPVARLTAALPGLYAALSDDAWERAARAVMTTDTFPKAAVRSARIGAATVRLQGFCKGSGMIAPDLATMLCFVFTDAKIPAAVLDSLLRKAVAASFHNITVDSDTSTSDSVFLFATGQMAHAPVSADTPAALRDFAAKLTELLQELALMVVRDGEGAQHLVEVCVTGAVSARSARRVAFAIANSPLVKTAVAGEDANWGRIVAAVGKAGEPAERDALTVRIGDTVVARAGAVVEGYDEAPVAAHMHGRLVRIGVDLALGRGKAVVWTCDLTHGYIDINGSYRS